MKLKTGQQALSRRMCSYPAGRRLLLAAGYNPCNGSAILSRKELAVWLAEDLAERHGQAPPQCQRTRRADRSISGETDIGFGALNGGALHTESLVCPARYP